MKRRVFALSTSAAAITAAVMLSLSAPGCGLLFEALSLLGIDLLGVTPAADFERTGNVEFSLLPKSEGGGISLGSFSSSDLDVEVENDDGTTSDCEFVDDAVVEGSDFNAIALVVDDSGSMENYYPESEYGDLCTTCPHDPSRFRAEAAGELISHVQSAAPYSRIGVFDFGPDPSSGMQATRVLADFTDDSSALQAGLGSIDGTEMVGTPMWDSLAEIIIALDSDAQEYEDLLRTGQVDIGGERGETTGNEGGEEQPPVEVGAEPETTTAEDVDTTNAEVKRMIVVISDGDDRDSVSYTLDDVIALANQHNVVIHAIGLGPASAAASDPRLLVQGQIDAVQNLERLAQETGGYYAAAEDAAALTALYEGVAVSMTEGYATTTYTCQPTETAGAFASRRIPTTGERVRGTISLGDGIDLPWAFIAP